MNPQIKQRIESVINNIEQLPSIPEVATRIINMVNDPEVSFKAIADEISKDQMITTNILKLCNSAYFSKGKEISSVDRAIVTLGLKEVKDAVILAATKIVLNKIIMGYDLAKGELWRHGLYVAVLAKKIALMKGKKDIADVAFTGGLTLPIDDPNACVAGDGLCPVAMQIARHNADRSPRWAATREECRVGIVAAVTPGDGILVLAGCSETGLGDAVMGLMLFAP